MRRRKGGKDKECIDCVQSDARAFRMICVCVCVCVCASLRQDGTAFTRWNPASISESESQDSEKTLSTRIIKSDKEWYRPIPKRAIKPPYSISQATPIDSLFWCRLPTAGVLSSKAHNHASMTFDHQAQVSQGHTTCRNKGNCRTEVRGGGGLEPVKLARYAACHPKPWASLKNAP